MADPSSNDPMATPVTSPVTTDAEDARLFPNEYVEDIGEEDIADQPTQLLPPRDELREETQTDAFPLLCACCGRRVLAWVPGPARICAECDGKVSRPGGRLQGMWPRVSLISGGKKVRLPVKAAAGGGRERP